MAYGCLIRQFFQFTLKNMDKLIDKLKKVKKVSTYIISSVLKTTYFFRNNALYLADNVSFPLFRELYVLLKTICSY